MAGVSPSAPPMPLEGEQPGQHSTVLHTITYPSLQTEGKQDRPSGQASGSRIEQVLAKYEISSFFANKLKMLEYVDVGIIVDDSGSMSTLIKDKWTREQGIFDRTRWDEARDTCLTLADMLLLLRPSRTLTIHFLNRGAITLSSVADVDALRALFATAPGGYTPLEATYTALLKQRALSAATAETTWFTLIITDGEPTDGKGAQALDSFRACLRRTRLPESRYPITVALCTNEASTVKYFNSLDRDLDSFDVVGDYHSEKEEILAVQGQDFAFTRADYLVKLLLGSMDAELDELDERSVGHARRTCTIL